MGPTRPSSAVFGYPPLNIHGTLPPVPLPRLQAPTRPRQRHQPDPDSSDSEPQDKDRADLIPQNSGFHVPRPKSRSSLAVNIRFSNMSFSTLGCFEYSMMLLFLESKRNLQRRGIRPRWCSPFIEKQYPDVYLQAVLSNVKSRKKPSYMYIGKDACTVRNENKENRFI